MKKIIPIILAVMLFQSFVPAAETIIIPYRPDPPIGIDGFLEDWRTVPNVYDLDSKEQLIFAEDKWDGPKDLSGKIHLAWRPEGLFIAADVTDDVFQNSGAGHEMFRGDHIELYLDTDVKSPNEELKDKNSQFQISLSPGNLNDNRPLSAFGRINPEVFRHGPQPGGSIVEAIIEGRKTGNGYIVEALIPWSALNLANVKKGKMLRIALVIGDRDSSTNAQETMITIANKPRNLFKSQDLTLAILSDSDGTPIEPEVIVEEKKQKLSENLTLAPQTAKTVTFDFDRKSDKGEVILKVSALLQFSRNAGFTEALTLTLNGQEITGKELTNKTVEINKIDGSGILKVYNAQYGFTLPYAANFIDANLKSSEGNSYAVYDMDAKISEFEFDVAKMLKDTGNQLVVKHLRSDINVPMLLEPILLITQPKTAKKVDDSNTPVMAAETFFPGKSSMPQVSVKSAGNNNITLKFPDGEYQINSNYSTPDGQWVNDSNKYFSLKRQVENKDGYIIVKDSFTNLTPENLGVMQRHEFTAPEKSMKFHLNGLKRQGGVRGYFQSGNDTSFAAWDKYGIGMAPLNDAFKVHAENYLVGKNGVGICDRMLVIPPKSTYQAEWMIIPSTDNYWDFINKFRQYLDVNFKLDGNWTFLQPFPPASDLDDAFLKDFFAKRNAKYVSYGDPFMKILPDGDSVIFAKGSAMLDDKLFLQPKGGYKAFDRFFASWRKASPGIKIMSYYQCFLDSHPDARQKFKGSELLNSAGQPLVYGYDHYPIFVPTLDNRFGREQEEVLDLMFSRLKADGIFWDEMSHSMALYHYGKPWDKVSGDIDLATHKVTQLKSSVSLITGPWRLKMAKKALSKGQLVANGWLYCKEIRDLKFPVFTETAQSTFATRTHLHTPIVLSDHLSETSFDDTYRNILKGLEYGCVFYYYRYELPMQYETITSKMYPITPVELGNGFIIGKERILTKKSGFFGWGDNSDSEVFIYDNKGKLIENAEAPVKVIDGKKFRELNLKPNQSAAIVRKQ